MEKTRHGAAVGRWSMMCGVCMFVCLRRGYPSKICTSSCLVWVKNTFVLKLLCVLIFFQNVGSQCSFNLESRCFQKWSLDTREFKQSHDVRLSCRFLVGLGTVGTLTTKSRPSASDPPPPTLEGGIGHIWAMHCTSQVAHYGPGKFITNQKRFRQKAQRNASHKNIFF